MAIKGDFLLKLERAQRHLEDFKAEAHNWLNDPNNVRYRKEREDPEYIRLIATVEPVPPDPFSLLIGDVLHNFRGALDHLAYALMMEYTKTPSEQMKKGSQFPIYGDEDGKGKSAVEMDRSGDFLRTIGGIDPAVQTVIKNLQPYQREKKFTSHPLWHLHDLSNKDKHRLLLLTTLYVSSAITSSKEFFSPKIEFEDTFVEGETPILRIKITPEDEMITELKANLGIAFQSGGVADGRDVTEVLSGIETFVSVRVFGPLARFLH